MKYVLDGSMIPLGYQQLTGMSSAAHLSRPPKARVAILQAEAQDVRYRDDGTNPSATVGMLLKAGTEFLYTGDLPSLRFLEAASGAILNVSYYGDA